MMVEKAGCGVEAVSLRVHRAVMLAVGAAARWNAGLRLEQRRTSACDPKGKQQSGERSSHKAEGLYYITEPCDIVARAAGVVDSAIVRRRQIRLGPISNGVSFRSPRDYN